MISLTASMKEVSNILKKHVDIADRMGNIIYSSEASRVGSTIGECDIEKLVPMTHSLYIHIKDGSSEEISLTSMILNDKLSEGTADIYQQFLVNIIDGIGQPEEYCRKLNIPCDGRYIVYCINLSSKEHFYDAYSLISNSFYDDENLWVFSYDDEIMMLEKAEYLDTKVEANARMVKDMVNTELYTQVHIGIGDTCEGITNIKRSMEEGREALRIGKMFNLPDDIFMFKNILSERIISLIPEDKVDELAGQIFSDKTDLILDEEMARTVDVFFKNNLNISDSSRILYIHRNTLLYRLDKLQKATGLDIRKFEDAVTFKLGYLLKLRRIK